MIFENLQTLLDTRQIPLQCTAYSVLESTNKTARKMLEDGTNNCLVVAERQSGGRGRLGRKWVSDQPLGIWATLGISISINPQEYLRAISLAIAEEMRDRGAENVFLKWPNDVLINKKKVAGILAETIQGPKGTNALALGFGINILQETNDFPPELRDTATSLLLQTGEKHDLEKTLAGILYLFFQIISLDISERFNRYRKLLSTLEHHWKLEGKRILAKNLMEDGGLEIEDENGNTEIIYSGTLTQ